MINFFNFFDCWKIATISDKVKNKNTRPIMTSVERGKIALTEREREWESRHTRTAPWILLTRPTHYTIPSA